MNRESIHSNKRYRSFALIAMILVLAVGSWIVMGFMPHSDIDQREVHIIDGEGQQHFIPAADNGDYSFTTELGTNTIHVEDGSVWMASADCPNQDCVHLGDIHGASEVILCLPNQFMVTIIDADDEDSPHIDSISG